MWMSSVKESLREKRLEFASTKGTAGTGRLSVWYGCFLVMFGVFDLLCSWTVSVLVLGS